MSARGGVARRWAASLLVGLAVLIIVLLVLVAEPMRVTSVSMSPTLSAGDHIVIDKLSLRWRPPAIGELVVFREPEGGALAVKRVVALGGQTVALEDGVLHIDGVAQPEAELDHRGVDSVYFGPVTVPVGAVFVLGDNRGESIDSRAYGAIGVDDLVGRVTLRL